MKKIHILGGGTFSHVRAHLALAAPAFGETARAVNGLVADWIYDDFDNRDFIHHLHLTKMADSTSSLVTNDDVEHLVDELISDPDTKIIIFNIAMCDFDGQIGYVESGKYASRLKTREWSNSHPYMIRLTPTDKLLSKIRKERKDIFLVAFKTTCGATEDEQYIAGLHLLKENSCNLVLANDLKTRCNMIVVPEEARYSVTTDRQESLRELVNMTMLRSNLHFTRSTVLEGRSIQWNSSFIPSSLRTVVNYCIEHNAYKPFRGKTAGHFAVKVDDVTFLTSKRSTNFNELNRIGLVQVISSGKDSVIAIGAKPSVGGMSQRIIFSEHPEMDCIVHFHCPIRDEYWKLDSKNMGFEPLSITPQYPYECGSHECGQNTSNHLQQQKNGIKAVYLDEHGPNIVFNRNIDPQLVINFIDKHFDLSQKTGGLVNY